MWEISPQNVQSYRNLHMLAGLHSPWFQYLKSSTFNKPCMLNKASENDRQICIMAAGKTQLDMNNLNLGLDLDLSTLNDFV